MAQKSTVIDLKEGLSGCKILGALSRCILMPVLNVSNLFEVEGV